MTVKYKLYGDERLYGLSHIGFVIQIGDERILKADNCVTRNVLHKGFTMGLLQQFEMLSESEKLFVASNPYSAPVIRFSADEATQKTIQIFGHNGHNDMSDAFRHCYFAALLSRDLGYYDALDYLNAHERFPNNPREEKRMDMANNYVGADIGQTQRPNHELAELCLNAAQGGRLVHF